MGRLDIGRLLLWRATRLCMEVSSQPMPKLAEMNQSNALEADMRVWRHTLQTKRQRILIYSPDTDVYNIGLTLVQPSSQHLVQINLPSQSTTLHQHQ